MQMLLQTWGLRLGFWMLLLLETSAGLNCCFAPLGEPVVLACDLSKSDSISAVPFAFYGAVPVEARVCGHETMRTKPSCGVDLTKILSERCRGHQTCEVDWSAFASECLGPNELVVRWECQEDHQRDQKHGQEANVPLPFQVPLNARGSIIVDSTNERVRLRGVNWPGAHITHVPSGLDRSPVASIATRIRTLGFNIVRLTWDVSTVLSNPKVSTRLVAANPWMEGMRALDVMNETIKALETAGVAVIVDNHMLDTDWCCAETDCNAFWFNANHSMSDWLQAWRIVARRSRAFKAVVGAGLKNEIRYVETGRSWGSGPFCNASFFAPGAEAGQLVSARWATGPRELQWRAAAEQAGKVVLEENPNLLVSIGGLAYSADLREFRDAPPNLPKNKLVYEVHSYPWQHFTKVFDVDLPGPALGVTQGAHGAQLDCKRLGKACAGFTCTTQHSCEPRAGGNGSDPIRGAQPAEGRYSAVRRYNADMSDFGYRNDQWWGYLVREKIAPVVITEFGFAHNLYADEEAFLWWEKLSGYLGEEGPLAESGGLDWIYWAWPGEQSGGTSRHVGATETFGVMNHCMTAPASQLHMNALRSVMGQDFGRKGPLVPLHLV